MGAPGRVRRSDIRSRDRALPVLLPPDELCEARSGDPQLAQQPAVRDHLLRLHRRLRTAEHAGTVSQLDPPGGLDHDYQHAAERVGRLRHRQDPVSRGR